MKYLIIIISLLWTTGIWALDIPDLGVEAEQALPNVEAAKMGKKMMIEIERSGKILDDSLANYYLQSLGNKLVAAVGVQQTPIHFFWVKDPAINAFALPGNYIGVHTGLFAYTTTDSELAAVMSHEIAHVAQHHIARMMEQAQHMQLPMMAAMLGSLLLAAHNPNAGEGALMATMAGANQMAINFTRTHEAEADRVGIGILARANFNPDSMANFFDKMAKATRYDEELVPEFLNTHPVSDARIADAKARAKFYPHKNYVTPQQFYLIHARLAVLLSDSAQAVREFTAQLKNKKYLNLAAAHYGHALALFQNADPAAAKTELAALLAEDKDEFIYALALADCEIALNQVPTAITLLKQFNSVYPDNAPILQAYTEALLLPQAPAGSPAIAVSLLENYTQTHRKEIAPYLWLAKASAAAGFNSQSHQVMATYYEKMADPVHASTQLKIALRLSKDPYSTQAIQSRLRLLAKKSEAIID